MEYRFPNLKQKRLVVVLCLAFPLGANASTLESTLVAAGDYYQTPVSKSVLPTSGAFSETAIFTKLSYPASQGTSTASADGLGHFGAATSLTHQPNYDPGKVSGSAHLVFSDSIVNSTATSQEASFGISVNALSFNIVTGWMGDTSANFTAKVFVNNSTTASWESSINLGGFVNYSCSDSSCLSNYLANEQPLLIQQSGPLVLSQTTSFASVVNGKVAYSYGYALVTPYVTSLALGNIAPDEKISVRYEIDIAAENYAYGGAVAVSFDDPSGISLGGAINTPVAASLAFAQPVPEPESYAMLLAGLALLAGTTRRRCRSGK